MKVCPRCGEKSKFHKNSSRSDRLQVWCAVCMREYVADRARKNGNKIRAGEALRRAILSHTMKRGLCVSCGRSENVDGHHEDYSKPLNVIWMCRSCHMKHHRGSYVKEEVLR